MRLQTILRFILSLWLLITINFFLLRFLPGTPLDRTESLSASVDRKWVESLRLDEPLVNQYFFYLGQILKGDLGPSISFPGSSAADIIQNHVSVTLTLNLLSLCMVFVISVGLTGLQLKNPEGVSSKIARFFSLAVNSAPSILLGPLLIYIFSVKLNWLPAAFLSTPVHYILPALILALRPAVYLSRSLGTIMDEELRKDYIRTAKAKGLSQNRILFGHALKNSVVPVLGLLGPITVGILSGSAFVEIVFAVPGLGGLFVESLNERDYFLASALVFIFGSLLMFLSFFFDLVSQWVDARLREAS